MIEGILTIIFMFLFIALCIWVYRPKSKSKYQAAANIPFNSQVAANEGSIE